MKHTFNFRLESGSDNSPDLGLGVDSGVGRGPRLGICETSHGSFSTPAFMPVATRGGIRGVTLQTLRDIGFEIMLANTLHLKLRPGEERLKTFGGLHKFSGWERPILTDSGGFQVFSLASKRKLDLDGVTFRSPIDGDLVRLTPESVMQTQKIIGSDIRMVLDWCPALPATAQTLTKSVEYTVHWARRSRACIGEGEGGEGEGAVFGIVQGGLDNTLRKQCLDELLKLEFEGYALGGLSVGESQAEMQRVLTHICPFMPIDKPRYLMGVGKPLDILMAVESGIDMFDCVLPTRNGRNGTLFTDRGEINMRNQVHATDISPVEKDCPCTLCTQHTRAYLHHLFKMGDITASLLAVEHNLTYYFKLMQRIRKAISKGTFAALRQRLKENWESGTKAREQQRNASNLN